MGQPGLISLAGGLPDPSYFPFSALGGQLLAADTFATNPAPDPTPAPKQKQGWLSGWFGSSSGTQKISVPKNAKVPAPDALQLSTALQYGGAQGLVWLQHWLKDWVAQVSPPAYEDW
jgi:aromatic amino acid aminotransferase I